MIQINTKYGAMKNKRYLPADKVPLSVWKAIVNAAVAEKNRILAVTPASIKKAMTDELKWFARVKANNYSRTTHLTGFNIAEIKQLTDFQRTKCGIKFAA